jgi:hypothetical protein
MSIIAMNRPLLFYYRHRDRTITNQGFGMILTQACDKSTTPANVKVGFRVTEIDLFNPSVIPNEAFVPGLVVQNEEALVPSVLTLIETPDRCVL